MAKKTVRASADANRINLAIHMSEIYERLCDTQDALADATNAVSDRVSCDATRDLENECDNLAAGLNTFRRAIRLM